MKDNKDGFVTTLNSWELPKSGEMNVTFDSDSDLLSLELDRIGSHSFFFVPLSHPVAKMILTKCIKFEFKEIRHHKKTEQNSRDFYATQYIARYHYQNLVLILEECKKL